MTTLNTPPAVPYARLMSVAGVRGSRIVDNAEMCTHIDSSDEWIQQRTGIVERRWVGADQTPRSMAVEAGRQAIENAGLQPRDIDALIVATISHYQQSPSLAVSVAADLGLPNPPAFDISAACAGYCYLVELGASLVRAGSAKHVLIIGVEALSEMINLEDRGTAFLFADGAGASVIGPSDEPAISPAVWGSHGEEADVITVDDWRVAATEGRGALIRMDGSKVFKWTTTEVAGKALETLAAAGITAEDLDVFIPHQANNRITDSMLRRLKLPASVVVSRDITHMGNASAASIPIAMAALLEDGTAQPGQLALIIGFGAGLAYAGQVVRLP